MSSSSSPAESLAEQAATLFKADDYASAAPLFQQAYAISNVPGALWNYARCFEELAYNAQAQGSIDEARQDAQEAVRAYKEFSMKQAKVDPAAAAQAEQQILAVQAGVPQNWFLVLSWPARLGLGAGVVGVAYLVWMYRNKRAPMALTYSPA